MRGEGEGSCAQSQRAVHSFVYEKPASDRPRGITGQAVPLNPKFAWAADHKCQPPPTPKGCQIPFLPISSRVLSGHFILNFSHAATFTFSPVSWTHGQNVRPIPKTPPVRRPTRDRPSPLLASSPANLPRPAQPARAPSTHVGRAGSILQDFRLGCLII
jgi:hypothetical protein